MQQLGIIAVTGLAISAVCLGAAAAVGGRDFGGVDLSMFGDRPRCERMADAAATSRILDWDGSDHLSLSVPARAHYAPGGDGRLHASGDAQTLAHLRVRDGRIELDCNPGWGDRETIDLELPGVPIHRFAIAGSGKLMLDHLDQDDMKIGIAGSGSITANGKVHHTSVNIAGSGNADLRDVTTEIATVHIAGSGDTDIAPSEEADIHIAGSGNVNLHGNPRRLDTHIAGSGRIRNAGGGI